MKNTRIVKSAATLAAAIVASVVFAGAAQADDTTTIQTFPCVFTIAEEPACEPSTVVTTHSQDPAVATLQQELSDLQYDFSLQVIALRARDNHIERLIQQRTNLQEKVRDYRVDLRAAEKHNANLLRENERLKRQLAALGGGIVLTPVVGRTINQPAWVKNPRTLATPCAQEDSANCFWDAARGNGLGHSFYAVKMGDKVCVLYRSAEYAARFNQCYHA